MAGSPGMIKAALVDLDGFLVNSEEIYLKANKIYFKKLGFEFSEDLHRQGTGKRFEDWIKTVVPTEKSGEQVLRERNVVFFKLAKKELKLLPGAKSLLEMLHKNFKTALVTSSKKNYVDLVFSLSGMEKYFDIVITGEDVNRGKPNPECYLLAAKKLKVLPEDCAVFEDAPSGVLAGKNAGMRVVAVPSRFVKGDVAFNKADFVLDNLNQVTLEIEGWLNRG